MSAVPDDTADIEEDTTGVAAGQPCEEEGCDQSNDPSTHQSSTTRRRPVEIGTGTRKTGIGTRKRRTNTRIQVTTIDNHNDEEEPEEEQKYPELDPAEDQNHDDQNHQERKVPNQQLPELTDDELPRPRLFSLLSRETIDFLNGRKRIPSHPDNSLARTSPVSQTTRLWPSRIFNGLNIYSTHVHQGNANLNAYPHIDVFPYMDGPIIENSHLITSIVLGATHENPRMLISFNYVHDTYVINVVSSNRADNYANEGKISKFLKQAFIIIHVDVSNVPDASFMSNLKQLCTDNHAYVHFYTMTCESPGSCKRILRREGQSVGVRLMDINIFKTTRVLYTRVHYYCFV